MRLEEHQQAVELANFSGFERGANLHRVVAVIVDHGNVVHDALNVEAPAYARKLAQRLANQLCGNI